MEAIIINLIKSLTPKSEQKLNSESTADISDIEILTKSGGSEMYDY